MNPRVALAALLTGALAIVGGAVGLALNGDEVAPEVEDRPLEPSKVALLRDGGTGYVQRVRTPDGGEALRLVPPGCVRRLSDAGVNACRQRLSDGGVRDQGALNRFPAALAVGTRCQPVACSVMAGEEADAEEDVLIERERTRDGGR